MFCFYVATISYQGSSPSFCASVEYTTSLQALGFELAGIRNFGKTHCISFFMGIYAVFELGLHGSGRLNAREVECQGQSHPELLSFLVLQVPRLASGGRCREDAVVATRLAPESQVRWSPCPSPSTQHPSLLMGFPSDPFLSMPPPPSSWIYMEFEYSHLSQGC